MTDEPCTETNCSVQTHPASEGHIDGPGELERLRAEVARLTAITIAQGQNVSWMSYHDACAGRDAAGRRALKAEAALTRVENAIYDHPDCIGECGCAVNAARAALDGA